jgi:NADH:ubiquinone oxidoreductase subunit F (NADH-binding)
MSEQTIENDEDPRAEEDAPETAKLVRQLFEELHRQVAQKESHTDGDKQITQQEDRLLEAVKSSGGANEGLYGFAGGLFWSIIQEQHAKRKMTTDGSSKDDATKGTPKDTKAEVRYVKDQVQTKLSQCGKATGAPRKPSLSLNNLRDAIMCTLQSRGTTKKVFPHVKGASYDYAIQMVLGKLQAVLVKKL